MHGYKCPYGNNYRRGHEKCSRLPHAVKLSKGEKKAKEAAIAKLVSTSNKTRRD